MQSVSLFKIFFRWFYVLVTLGGEATYEEMCHAFISYYPRVSVLQRSCMSQVVPNSNGLLFQPVCTGVDPNDFREAIQYQPFPVVCFLQCARRITHNHRTHQMHQMHQMHQTQSSNTVIKHNVIKPLTHIKCVKHIKHIKHNHLRPSTM